MLAVTGSKPDAHVRFFFLALVALGSKPQRAQKGGFCAAALAGVASLGFAAGRLFSFFFAVAFITVLVQYIRLLAVTGSKLDVHVWLCFLAFGALGTTPQRGQKGELYVAALAAGASLGFWRGSLVFFLFF